MFPRLRRGGLQWTGALPGAVVAALLCCANSGAAQHEATQRALDRALSGTSAVAVVLDDADGRLLAVERPREAAERASAPGSTLKPFFLAAALEKGAIREDTTLECHRHLRILGRDLTCSHPAALTAFRAEDALAYSCNSYFAQLSERFTPQQVIAVLEQAGLGSPPHLFAGESAGMLREADSDGEQALQVLGLEGVTATPAQMAEAYWQLWRRIDAAPTVRRGLEESVEYGMANPARTEGVALLGKTGTASDAGQAWTHGWFAGMASCGGQRIVVTIYVPRGNGGDAALLAHRFLSAWRSAVTR